MPMRAMLAAASLCFAAAAQAQTTIIHRYIHWGVDLCVAMTPIAPAFATFQVRQDTHLEVIAHVGLAHRGNYPVGVGWGLRWGLRGPMPSEGAVSPSVGPGVNPPPWIKGAKAAGNIASYAEHYASPAITAYKRLTPGWYRLELWGNSHGATNGPLLHYTDAVVEVRGSEDPHNNIIIRLTPAN